MPDRPLTAAEVLADLFAEEDFDILITAGDDERAARLAIQRLLDAGFIVLHGDDPRLHREDGHE